MNFTVMQLIIMFLIAYVCLYALIDRVMKLLSTVLQPEHMDGSEKPE